MVKREPQVCVRFTDLVNKQEAKTLIRGAEVETYSKLFYTFFFIFF